MSLEEGSGVQLNTSNAIFESGDGLEITWLPETVVPAMDPDLYTVDVRLSCFDNESDTFEELAVVASDIPNSGQFIITFPAINISDVCPVSIQVSLSGSTASLIKRNIGDVIERLIDVGVTVIAAGIRAIIRYYTGGFFQSIALRLLCEGWCLLQPAGIGATLLRMVAACPPTIEMALCDNGFLVEGTFVSRIFHPGTDRCFRQKNNGEG